MDELVRLHISRGRNVNARDESGTPLLGLAILKGHFEISKLLLEAGADPWLTDLNGRNGLELARLCGSSQLVGLLSSYKKEELAEAELELELLPVDSSDSWEVETEVLEPVGDRDLLDRAAKVEAKLSEFEFVNSDEDWKDVDAELPEHQLFAGVKKRELRLIRSELISFFESSLASGFVTPGEIRDIQNEYVDSMMRRANALSGY